MAFLRSHLMPPLPRGHRLSWAGFKLPHQHTTSSLLDSSQPSNPQTALSAVFHHHPILLDLPRSPVCTSTLHTVSRYLCQTAGYRLRHPLHLLRTFRNIMVRTLCGACAPDHDATSPPSPLVLPRTSATSWASRRSKYTIPGPASLISQA